MPHKTHHIQSMYYQSNQWMLSNVSVWWQNVVTMMYSLQWGIASYHLAVRYCSPQGLLGQRTEGIVLPGMAHSTTSIIFQKCWCTCIQIHWCICILHPDAQINSLEGWKNMSIPLKVQSSGHSRLHCILLPHYPSATGTTFTQIVEQCHFVN